MTDHDEASVVWDTTGPRHLGIAGYHRLLVTEHGLQLPRPVLNPNDPQGPELLRVDRDDLSEMAATEAWFRRAFDVAPNEVDLHRIERLALLRQDPDLRIIDLTDQELDDAAVFRSEGFAQRHNLDFPLGKGESAVLAVAMNRELRAGIDEYAARAVAVELDVAVVTTQEWLVNLVRSHSMTRNQADAVWEALLAGGFYGPQSLWD